ncbi:Rab-like protein 6 [Haplosporangium bisporale]|nr:Rab-like protein 6 [Haplosporangium bisporale]
MFKLWPFSSGQQNGAAPLDPQDHGVSTKVKPIHASFNKGIPLNMKIIIRGDIRAGKTSVFERLQGHPFRHDHEYMTTEQIQVANIPWQYAHTKDIIKVEVWDVVDKGVQSGELRTSTSNATLKIDNTPASPKAKATQGTDTAPHAAFALDASTIDVYRNTDGVILVYDVSKPWTFEYVAKTLAEVPTNIPVLILSNFTDDGNRSAVDNDKLEELMEEHNAERFKLPCAPANLVRHLDTSMKTGLGLKEIHESFGIPFLNVLRETHRKQFDQKTLEIAELLKALDTHEQERTKASQQSRAPISAKDTTPTKKQPPLPAAIQTSHVVDDVKDVNEDASSSSFTSAPEELTSVNGRKKDVEIKVLSTLEAEDVEEPSPMSISSENSAEVDGEDQPGDAEDEGSPDPGQGGSTEGEKKKKKKNKKKGKKGK